MLSMIRKPAIKENFSKKKTEKRGQKPNNNDKLYANIKGWQNDKPAYKNKDARVGKSLCSYRNFAGLTLTTSLKSLKCANGSSCV